MSEALARLMDLALAQARKAAAMDEVPVGAIIARGPLDAPKIEIVARAHNRTERDHDPCAHAELLAIRKAAKKLGRWRLNDCALIVTLEPCAMCAGAAVWARMGRLIYAAPDPKAGACGSVLQVASHEKLNHRIRMESGLREQESAELLRAFFRAKRSQSKA